jgi:hypothetical protein
LKLKLFSGSDSAKLFQNVKIDNSLGVDTSRNVNSITMLIQYWRENKTRSIMYTLQIKLARLFYFTIDSLVSSCCRNIESSNSGMCSSAKWSAVISILTLARVCTSGTDDTWSKLRDWSCDFESFSFNPVTRLHIELNKALQGPAWINWVPSNDFRWQHLPPCSQSAEGYSQLAIHGPTLPTEKMLYEQ